MNQSQSTVFATAATESIDVLDHSVATVNCLLIFSMRLFNALFVGFAEMTAISIGLQMFFRSRGGGRWCYD